ncbi:MAG: AraC family transcriptional regulator [Paracoccaceae bacterium]
MLETDIRTVLLSAHVSWGGAQNPLLAALPPEIRHDLAVDPEMRAVVDLLLSEQAAARCGSASVLNRLGEVLLVRLMRRQIERGQMRVGLLGGLADPRLSRAIVAMHHRPDQDWRVDLLAQEAGLSVSRFAELFRLAMGVTPLAYLRQWRLTLARQDIERGDRVQRVANRYCYGSPEALSRAVSQQYGQTPTQIRKAAIGGDAATMD